MLQLLDVPPWNFKAFSFDDLAGSRRVSELRRWQQLTQSNWTRWMREGPEILHGFLPLLGQMLQPWNPQLRPSATEVVRRCDALLGSSPAPVQSPPPDVHTTGFGMHLRAASQVVLGGVLPVEVAGEGRFVVVRLVPMGLACRVPLIAGRGSCLLRLQRSRNRGTRGWLVAGSARQRLRLRPRTLASFARFHRVVSGRELWGPNQLLVSRGLYIAQGAQLVLLPGTVLLLWSNATVQVDGRLELLGSEDSLISVSAFCWNAVWGEVTITNASAVIQHAHISAGASPVPGLIWGHGRARALLRLKGRSTLMIRRSMLSDAAAKGVGCSEFSRVTLEDVMFARLSMGAELHQCCMEALRCHLAHLPRWGAGKKVLPEDDDNDGFYVRESMSATRSCGTSSIIDSVFADGGDDAIDHCGGQLEVRRVLIRSFQHEGVAASGPCPLEDGVELPPSVLLQDSFISRCGGAGVEAGYGHPVVRVERSMVRRCGIGFRFGDDYDWGCQGRLEIYNSRAEDCGAGVVAASYAPGYVGLQEPSHEQLLIRCSWLPGWQVGYSSSADVFDAPCGSRDIRKARWEEATGLRDWRRLFRVPVEMIPKSRKIHRHSMVGNCSCGLRFWTKAVDAQSSRVFMAKAYHPRMDLRACRSSRFDDEWLYAEVLLFYLDQLLGIYATLPSIGYHYWHHHQAGVPRCTPGFRVEKVNGGVTFHVAATLHVAGVQELPWAYHPPLWLAQEAETLSA
eukprot:symbB.v1.2.032081.t1/scaffold3800.1/size50142/2